jgi:hypothetical protein
LSGEYAGFFITVRRYSAKDGVFARVHVDAEGRIPSSISLTRESGYSFVHKLVAEPEIRLGERVFDAELFVTGPERLIRAVLDAPCREQVLALFLGATDAKVADGFLSFSVKHADNPERLASRIQQGIDVAEALSVAEAEVLPRLVEDILSDDQLEVRLRNLEFLLRGSRGQDFVHRMLVDLLCDPQPEMRRAALLGLGKGDIESLLAVADKERDPRVRIALLGHLAAFAGPRLWPAIKDALRCRDEGVQRAAADAARVTKYTALAPRISRKIARQFATADAPTLVSLVDALAALRDPSTEPTLITLLQHDSRDVLRASAAALGEFGTVIAVEPLLACSERLLLAGDTKRAVLAAVGRIQSRLGEAAIGGLSLVASDTKVGALSLSAEAPPEGAVSKVK